MEYTKRIIIADDITLRISDNTNTKFRTSIPIINGSQRANHMPVIVIKDMDSFLEFVDDYLGV